jgi:acyl-[acyl carrier protein]--UDP-N-acetylglucosamine O-acyltransferase
MERNSIVKIGDKTTIREFVTVIVAQGQWGNCGRKRLPDHGPYVHIAA